MRGFRFFGVAFALAVGSAGAQAALYDLNSDWSNISNPNGVWSLNEGSNALPFIASWIHGGPAWARAPGGPGHVPAFFKAQSAAGGFLSYNDWQAGDIVVHTTDPGSGGGNGIATVRFTAPNAGTASIMGDIWKSSRFNRPQDWLLLHNGMTTLAGGSLPSSLTNGRGARDIFSIGSLALAAGDTLELRVIRNTATPFGDFVGLNFSVDLQSATAVPEPATWLMLLSGFGLVGLVHRMRQRVTQAAA